MFVACHAEILVPAALGLLDRTWPSHGCIFLVVQFSLDHSPSQNLLSLILKVPFMEDQHEISG